MSVVFACLASAMTAFRIYPMAVFFGVASVCFAIDGAAQDVIAQLKASK